MPLRLSASCLHPGLDGRPVLGLHRGNASRGAVQVVTRITIPNRFENETEFQAWLVNAAHENGWGISGAQDKKRDAELAAYGQPPDPLTGLVFHPRIMYRSEPGWPDLTLIRRRDRRLLFVECKTDEKASKVTPRQAKVLDLLRELAFDPDAFYLAPVQYVDEGRAPHIQVFVWRPSDIPTILQVLA